MRSAVLRSLMMPHCEVGLPAGVVSMFLLWVRNGTRPQSYGEKALVDFGDRQRTILNEYLSAPPTIHFDRAWAKEAWLKPCPPWLM